MDLFLSHDIKGDTALVPSFNCDIELRHVEAIIFYVETFFTEML